MTSCCKKYLKEYTGRLGMGTCPCGIQWYHFTPGWAKKWGTDKVFNKGKYMGLHDSYNALKEIMKRTEEIKDE
jgi:hypothetical protein